MPIYAYRCTSCQHEFDVLQKVSDATLTVCPECGQPTLAKQLTAAGFQLKGSGWYATDFKDGGSKPDAGKAKSSEDKGSAAGGGESADSAKGDGGAGAKEGAGKESAKEPAKDSSKDSAKESTTAKPSPAPSAGGGN
jgi:putative FmdB family regulatory protein